MTERSLQHIIVLLERQNQLIERIIACLPAPKPAGLQHGVPGSRTERENK